MCNDNNHSETDRCGDGNCDAKSCGVDCSDHSCQCDSGSCCGTPDAISAADLFGFADSITIVLDLLELAASYSLTQALKALADASGEFSPNQAFTDLVRKCRNKHHRMGIESLTMLREFTLIDANLRVTEDVKSFVKAAVAKFGSVAELLSVFDALTILSPLLDSLGGDSQLS